MNDYALCVYCYNVYAKPSFREPSPSFLTKPRKVYLAKVSKKYIVTLKPKNEKGNFFIFFYHLKIDQLQKSITMINQPKYSLLEIEKRWVVEIRGLTMQRTRPRPPFPRTQSSSQFQELKIH